MRVVFLGTPPFSVPALDALIGAGHQITKVYTQPPRRAGRGKALTPSAVHRRAEELGLDVRHPPSLKDADEQAAFADLKADVAVVVAYGQILPRAILEAPRFGCLNIHASLLPRWRGAAPIHRAVMAGDAETGVCIMQMDAGLDTGAVLSRISTPIGPLETTGDLHDRLADLGAKAIVSTVERLGAEPAMPQPEVGVTYAEKIHNAEAEIHWISSAVEVDRMIRGLSPAPGAWCEIGGERVKLLRSRVASGAGAPGLVLGGFTVACGDGAVEIIEVQRPGRKPQPAEEVLRGMKLPPRF